MLWYVATMPARAVQISIDAELLKRVDQDPETRQKGRSAFVRSAIASYLRARKRRQLDDAIAKAYAGAAAAMLAETSDLMEAQAWPDD